MNNQIKSHAILWADDDPDDIALMREVMLDVNNQHHIIEVYNGREALDYLHGAKDSDNLPCLIVLDMNMPVLSGRETLVLLKGDPVFRDIPTIVFTTSRSLLDRTFCERHNTEMLTKPLNLASLKEIILKMLSLCDES